MMVMHASNITDPWSSSDSPPAALFPARLRIPVRRLAVRRAFKAIWCVVVLCRFVVGEAHAQGSSRPAPRGPHPTYRSFMHPTEPLNGGDVFTPPKLLGHTSLVMVRRYVELAAVDVRRQHERFSPTDSARHAGGDREGRAVPGVRRRGVHDRHDPGDRRRAHRVAPAQKIGASAARPSIRAEAPGPRRCPPGSTRS